MSTGDHAMPAESTDLVSALKIAKTKPMCFAFVAKGNDGKLLVEKKRVPPKEAEAAKKECGGGTIYTGRCVTEDGTLVFEVAKEPPANLAELIKKIIKKESKLTLDVAVRVRADSSEDEQGEVESVTPVPPAPPGTEGTVQPAPQATEAGGHEVMQRLNAMTADIKAALAGPNKTAVQTRFVAVNTQIKGKDFVAAAKTLDELEGLVKAPRPTESAGPLGQSTPPAPPGTDSGGHEVMKRLNAMTADIKAALAGPNKTAVQTRFVAVNMQIKNKDYVAAAKTLDELEGLIKAPRPMESGGTGPQGDGKFSVMKLGKARIEWGQLASKAVADIGTLLELIDDEFGDDVAQKDQLASAKKRVEKLVADLKDELSPALDNVLNGKDETQRKPLIETAKGILAKYVKIVQSDPIMTNLDGNEVMPEMQVAGPMQSKLQEIAAALG
jgi:hypothetical protein